MGPQNQYVGTLMLKHSKEADMVQNRADQILGQLFQVVRHRQSRTDWALYL